MKPYDKGVGDTRKLDNFRSIARHKNKVVVLKRVEDYLNKNGPTTFMELVLDIDPGVTYSCLHEYRRQGLIKIKRLAGKRKFLMLGINWDAVNSLGNQLPAPSEIRRRKLSRLADCIEANGPLALKLISRKTGIPVSTLRYWRNLGWLKSTKKKGRVIITGVNYEPSTNNIPDKPPQPKAEQLPLEVIK